MEKNKPMYCVVYDNMTKEHKPVSVQYLEFGINNRYNVLREKCLRSMTEEEACNFINNLI